MKSKVILIGSFFALFFFLTASSALAITHYGAFTYECTSQHAAYMFFDDDYFVGTSRTCGFCSYYPATEWNNVWYCFYDVPDGRYRGKWYHP